MNSVTPQVGSSGGTLITVSGHGFGVNTEGLQVWHEQSDSDICEEVEVLEYGKFTCLTKAMEILPTDTLVLVTSTGKYDCQNTLAPE